MSSETDLPAQLQATRRLLGVATPRPWFTNMNDLVGGYAVGTSQGELSANAKGDDVADLTTHENADLIVAAVNALPLLLDVVEAAQLCRAVGALPMGTRTTTRNDQRPAVRALHAALDRLGEALPIS